MDSGASTVVDCVMEHTAIVAGKIVMLGGIGPVPLTQLRVGGGATAFLILFLARRGQPRSRPTRGDWVDLALAAVFGITLNQLLFISGIDATSAAHSGLIVALGPVMVLALACALRLESFTALKAARGNDSARFEL